MLVYQRVTSNQHHSPPTGQVQKMFRTFAVSLESQTSEMKHLGPVDVVPEKVVLQLLKHLGVPKWMVYRLMDNFE
jgi:hypothetical protein